MSIAKMVGVTLIIWTTISSFRKLWRLQAPTSQEDQQETGAVSMKQKLSAALAAHLEQVEDEQSTIALFNRIFELIEKTWPGELL